MQVSLQYYLQMNLPCLITDRPKIHFHNLQAHLPLTNQTYPNFPPDQLQLIPETHTVDFILPLVLSHGAVGGGLAVVDPC